MENIPCIWSKTSEVIAEIHTATGMVPEEDGTDIEQQIHGYDPEINPYRGPSMPTSYSGRQYRHTYC